MSQEAVTIARVYLEEGHDNIGEVINWLESTDLKGFTAFRGIAGLGDSHQLHTASLMDLSLNLPVVIEFFDSAEVVKEICKELKQKVNVQHIVSWPAQSGI